MFILKRAGRGWHISARSHHELAELGSFLKTDCPELVAKLTVGFDWIAAVEQSAEIGERVALLHLLALASRAYRYKDNRFAHRGEIYGSGTAQSIR
jgi:hypothetical protein